MSKTTISVAQQIHKSCAFFLLQLLHTEPSRTSIQSANYLWSNLVWWFCRHRVDSEANKYPYHQHDQQMNIVKDIDYNHFHWHPPICTQVLIVNSNKWATTCIILEWIIALQGEREPPDPRASWVVQFPRLHHNAHNKRPIYYFSYAPPYQPRTGLKCMHQLQGSMTLIKPPLHSIINSSARRQ